MFPSRLLGSMTLNLCPRRHLRIFSVHLRVVKPSENSTNRVKTQSKLNQNQIKSNTNQETKKNPNKQTNQNKSNKDSSNSLQIFPLHSMPSACIYVGGWQFVSIFCLSLVTCLRCRLIVLCFIIWMLRLVCGIWMITVKCLCCSLEFLNGLQNFDICKIVN